MSEKRPFNADKTESRDGFDSGISNGQRAEQARVMLATHPTETSGDLDCTIIDALADIMHLCDREDMEFEGGLLDVAREHYEEEK